MLNWSGRYVITLSVTKTVSRLVNGQNKKPNQLVNLLFRELLRQLAASQQFIQFVRQLVCYADVSEIVA